MVFQDKVAFLIYFFCHFPEMDGEFCYWAV